MNAMAAIIKKELRSYFYSPLAYIVLCVFVLVMGMVFNAFIGYYQSYKMQQMFQQGAGGITLDKLIHHFHQNMAFVISVIIPFITMRLFAEEKRQNTLELLLTVPITSFQLVMGKFLSAVIFTGVLIGVSMAYMGFLLAWGNPDINIMLISYLGLLLTISCYIGIGALCSAMVSSQAIAAVIALIVTFILYLLPQIVQVSSAKIGIVDLSAVFRYLAPPEHNARFSEGVIHLKDIVYYVSFIGLMIFLTHRAVESHRWK